MIGKLIKRNIILEGIIELEFQLESELEFLAGQDVSITIPEMPYPDSKGNRRYFSIASSPLDKTHIKIATRISDSGFKKTLLALEESDEVLVDEPYGEMILPDSTEQPLVFIAGGIGITPFLSMLRYIKEKNLNYDATLLYSNKTEAGTPYLEELQGMDRVLKNFRLLLVMTDDEDWIGENRRINQSLITEKIPNYLDVKFYFAGPPGLVSGIKASLDNLKVKEENMKFVEFAGY